MERARWLGVQLRSLLALVTVVEEGSFVAAARRLGYSRSTISHQIAQLESAIGVALVVRGSGSRSVTVTPAGGVVVAHGKAMLKLLENAESRVAGLRDERPAQRRFLGCARADDRVAAGEQGVRLKSDTCLHRVAGGGASLDGRRPALPREASDGRPDARRRSMGKEGVETSKFSTFPGLFVPAG